MILMGLIAIRTIVTKIDIMAITINNSTKVKPLIFFGILITAWY